MGIFRFSIGVLIRKINAKFIEFERKICETPKGPSGRICRKDFFHWQMQFFALKNGGIYENLPEENGDYVERYTYFLVKT